MKQTLHLTLWAYSVALLSSNFGSTIWRIWDKGLVSKHCVRPSWQKEALSVCYDTSDPLNFIKI